MNLILRFPLLFYIALFFSCGIIISTFICNYLLVSLLIFLFLFLLAIRTRTFFILIVLLSLFAGISLHLYNQKNLENKHFKKENENEKIEIVGRVLEIKADANRKSLIIDPDNNHPNSKSDIYGNVYLLTYESKHEINVNDFIRANIQLIDESDLSVGFKKYIAQKNCGLIVQAEKINKIRSTYLFFFWDSVQKAVNFTENTFKKYFSNQNFALAKSLLVGNREDLSLETKTHFQVAGLMHILAISGLHVAITIFILYSILQFLGINRITRIFIIILFLLFFIFFTGASPSVIRASLMTIVIFVYILLGRGKDFLIPLSLAAIFMLTRNPNLIFQPPFQLSFSAVLSLFFIYPSLSELIVSSFERIKGIFLSTISVQIGLFPFIVNYFHCYSLVAVFSNLIMIPLLPFVLFSLLISLICEIVLSQISKLFFIIANSLLGMVLSLAKSISLIPGGIVKLVSIPLWFYVIFYICLFVFIRLLKKKQFKIKLSFLFVLFIIIITSNLWVQVSRSNNLPYLEVTFFDVGQGDSILIESPEGFNILIDGGGSEFIIEQKLLSENINKIDLLVSTHPHNDHLIGLNCVLKKYIVGQIIDSGLDSSTIIYKEYRKLIKENEIQIQEVTCGDVFSLGRLIIEIVHPPPEKIYSDDSFENDNSLVLKIKYKDFSLLMTGDIEETGMNYLLNSNQNLNVDLYKVPHHGSSSSANAEFLNLVNPHIAVISVGKDNEFGHPASSTIDLLTSFCLVYRTDQSGNVKIASDGKNLWLVSKEKAFEKSSRFETCLSFSWRR